MSLIFHQQEVQGLGEERGSVGGGEGGWTLFG